MTDPLGQSQVLPYLEGLSKTGKKIHLISFEKEERFKSNKTLIEEQCSLSGIIWHPLKYTKKPPVLSTLYDLYRLYHTAKRLDNKYHFQIYHCRSQLTAMVGSILAKKNSAKYIFDMRGFWVDERIEGNIWNLSNPIFKIIYRLLKKKEKHLFLQANAIVSLTNKAIPLIKEIQEKPASKQIIKVIPCCADIDFFDPSKISNETKKKLRFELNIPDGAFILSYLGGIGTWYLCSEMLDFYSRLTFKFNDAYFLFITQENPEMILKLADEKGILRNKIIIKPAQRKEVPALLSLSDASVFFIKPSFSKQASSPTKQGEIMSMGIPLICNSGIGDTDLIVKEANSGVVCNSFSDASYDEAILLLTKTISIEKRNQIRQSANKYFSLKEGIASYNDLFNLLLDQE